MPGTPKINTRTVDEALRRLRRRAPQVAKVAAKLTAEAILAEAKSQDNIPIKNGDLQSSGVVSEDRGKVQFGFNIDYAAAVHETHKVKPHFLINAITQQGPRIVKDAIKIALERAGGVKRS